MSDFVKYERIGLNLSDLREETLKNIIIFCSLMGYLWLISLTLPGNKPLASPDDWIGIVLLLLGMQVCYRLRVNHLTISRYATVVISFAAAICATFTSNIPVSLCFLALPVIFSGVLLNQKGFIFTVFLACSSAWSVGVFTATPYPAIAALLAPPIDLQQLLPDLFPSQVMFPVLIIISVSLASWLSARNLFQALEWTWNGFEEARQNEKKARNHQAELRRALKNLDETMHRLERVNYMLAIAYDQAEEARHLKQQFAQTISHELRTPLNLIVGFTEQMVDNPQHYGGILPRSYLRDLSIVRRNARHLQTLVNDVLDLARIEAAQMTISPEQVEPEKLINEVAVTIKSLVTSHHLKLKVEISDHLPVIRVDPIRIRQVLINLLNNAVRFTEKGQISIGARSTDQEIVFFVADTGIGIAPQELHGIFEEFHQAKGGLERRREGAGLGLTISKRFVELHKGKIWAESQPGVGSTFFFSIPVQTQPILSFSQDKSPEELEIMIAKDREGPILLAVTQSISAAALLRRYLLGCRVIAVPTVEQASKIIDQIMPQVVLIDSSSASLSKHEIEQLSGLWGLKQVPVVSAPLPGENFLQSRLEVNGYLMKPIDRRALWDMLRQFGGEIDRILVVDDDQDFIQLIHRMLENQVRPYQIMDAGNGEEALKLIDNDLPDLILVDLMMPVMNGISLINSLHNNPRYQNIPIIAISGQEQIDQEAGLEGNLTIYKEGGIYPSEIIHWLQSTLDQITKPAISAAQAPQASQPAVTGNGHESSI